MRIVIKARHTEIDQALKDYAEQKIGEKCATYLDENDDAIICDIEFDDEFGPKGGEDKRVDVTLSLPHRSEALYISQESTTFQEAIDLLVDRLDQPLAKYKDLR